MNKKKLSGLLFSALIIFSLINVLTVQIIEAKPTMNIGLISFDAIALDNAVRLEWETGSESGTAAFRLKRGQVGEATDYLLDPETGDDLFIQSEGDVTTGSTYEFTDNTVTNNTVYTYILVEVESNGDEFDRAEVSVTVGSTPTATQIVVDDSNNATSQPTSTPRPPTATATTAGSNATTTAVPTNTIAPTATAAQAQATTSSEATATPVSNNQGDTQATAVADTSKPAETSAPSEVQEITSDADVAVAQAQEEAANTSTIDGNEEIAPSDSSQTESYPAPNAIGVNGTNNADSDAANDPVAIGSQNNAQQTSGDAYPAPAAQAENENSAGRAYLWGGFLVALLVLGVAVVGAIFLYTRKRNPDA